MTDDQCNRCKYAPAPESYSTSSGDDLPVWDCEKLTDPKMPFTMDEDTDCPCFEEALNDNIRFTSGYYDLTLHGMIPDEFNGTDEQAELYADAEYHPATKEFIIGLGSEFIILDEQSILDLKDMIDLVIEKESIKRR